MGQSRWANYLGKQVCPHTIAISTTYAGLERRVCENCGHVSIRYLSDAVKIFPDEDQVDLSGPGNDSDTKRSITCHRCHLTAEYITPDGLACGAHAWGAASMQVARLGEMWIPIHIDHNQGYDLD